MCSRVSDQRQMLLVTAARADRLFANGQYKEGLQTNRDGTGEADTRAALVCFTKALALAPSQPKYALSAGNMQLKLGAHAAAFALYEHAAARAEAGLTPQQREVRVHGCRPPLTSERTRTSSGVRA